ncbi:hypothetical protein VTK26DRAFT_187 [Humicola hyalothermophila]
MPDKTLRVVTYAAGASLAAITLVYVFGPTYFLDSQPSNTQSGAFSSRKKGVVGLSNPANDCFINSVLQALAGLGDLRLYLIRETHRRGLDDGSIYARVVPAEVPWDEGHEAGGMRFAKDTPDWKLEGLQNGSVTKSLKDILDALNERPLYKKTISAAPFVRALEEAFRQRISRQQQDAQEFLQVVAERLCDEYYAGRRARWFAGRTNAPVNARNSSSLGAAEQAGVVVSDQTAGPEQTRDDRIQETEEEDGFPLEGRFESQIECLTCGFKPRATESTFCTLTLNVPRVSSTSLGACFDGMFKTEFIDDFKCEKCRLLHALASFESESQRSASEAARVEAQRAVEKLRVAIATDPERPPEGVVLPDSRHAPKRRIARHIRMTKFPKILAIHLSRSIFDAGYTSQKNLAKVSFPEDLPLGGLLRQQRYKLLGVVTHKGSHNSGHYESFRRQTLYPPFSNPSTFRPSEAYSRTASPAPTPRVEPVSNDSEAESVTDAQKDVSARRCGNSPLSLSRSPARAPAECSIYSAATNAGDDQGTIHPENPAGGWLSPSQGKDSGATDPGSVETRPKSSSPKPSSSCSATTRDTPADSQRLPGQPRSARKTKQQKQQTRWWRISDDKTKEASTRDVLGMQREVYLLFYELERSNT